MLLLAVVALGSKMRRLASLFEPDTFGCTSTYNRKHGLGARAGAKLIGTALEAESPRCATSAGAGGVMRVRQGRAARVPA